MFKEISLVCVLFVAPVALVGCGGADEIPPTNDGAGMDKGVEKDMMEKSMESMEASMKDMDEEGKARMKKQMEMMKGMKGVGGSPGSSDEGGTPAPSE